MRIVWKDSNKKEYRPLKYRSYIISHFNDGWVTNCPGDTFIYRNAVSAMNALDQHLGLREGKPLPKRLSLGVSVVGRK